MSISSSLSLLRIPPPLSPFLMATSTLSLPPSFFATNSASSSPSSSKHPSSPSPRLHTLSFSGLRPIHALGSRYSLPSVRPGSRLNSRAPRIVCAVGDVSSEGTNYLIFGAIAIAVVGSAFPLLFSRKDLCPECDGAGFIRKPGVALAANAARKDEQQIVCPRCNGLGKLRQVDK